MNQMQGVQTKIIQMKRFHVLTKKKKKERKICCYQSLRVMCANDLLELLMLQWLNIDYRMHIFFVWLFFNFLHRINHSLYTVRYNEVGKSEISFEQRKKTISIDK